VALGICLAHQQQEAAAEALPQASAANLQYQPCRDGQLSEVVTQVPLNPPPRAPSAAMFASHAFLPATSDIPLTLGRKNRICCFGRKKIMTSKRVDNSPPGGPLLEWEGNWNEGNATVPISVPGTIHGN